MKRNALLLTSVLIFSILLCSCAALRRPIDSRSGFSNHLRTIETNIRSGDWGGALDSLEESKKTWKDIKPYLQLDIDHDYVNDIEASFTLLGGYIETQEKSHSLALILLIQDIWENIGSM